MTSNSTGMYINRQKEANTKLVWGNDSPNTFSHSITHQVSSAYSTSLLVIKYGELTATATIHVARMKKGHSLDLMSGERSGNTTAPNRSTAIRIRF